MTWFLFVRALGKGMKRLAVFPSCVRIFECIRLACWFHGFCSSFSDSTASSRLKTTKEF